ncbi:MAG: YbhB/YbcL family Raf kinase inhibitor-like protein [Ferruginibacter sp.]|nr:YbhB/YbcL family Raf kinase inhibitor-like protein [Ferruginibacter sp.]
MKNEEATKAVAYKRLKLSSTSFADNGMIPALYTCEGININPPLDIEQIPDEAKCLVLIVDDPDAPSKTWVHWIIWNIPVTHHIKENEVHGVEGVNDSGHHHYDGPCPPSGTHRYFFKVYALNDLLDLPASADKVQLEKAMSGLIVGFGEIVGLYKLGS